MTAIIMMDLHHCCFSSPAHIFSLCFLLVSVKKLGCLIFMKTDSTNTEWWMSSWAHFIPIKQHVLIVKCFVGYWCMTQYQEWDSCCGYYSVLFWGFFSWGGIINMLIWSEKNFPDTINQLTTFHKLFSWLYYLTLLLCLKRRHLSVCLNALTSTEKTLIIIQDSILSIYNMIYVCFDVLCILYLI